ncbi:hypothetical protein RJT34_06962 [Clitoria ternatea]|uniref:Uncharacterized protein n=1 Tax=Clitoria ternatea TaxID=43366 RepID=A0AAN9PTB1_CLITE
MFVHECYILRNVAKAYARQWFRIGSDDLIPELEEIHIVVPDEDMLHTKRRPKALRIRNEMDWVESETLYRCTLCQQTSHKRLTYPNAIRNGSSFGSSSGRGT